MLNREIEKHGKQEGYDAWITQWAELGKPPDRSSCPARWMPIGIKRSAFIQGWLSAKREYEQMEGKK